MIQNIVRKVIAFAAPATVLAFTLSAHATSLPGFAGKARAYGSSSCFAESWGSAQNICSANTDLNIPLAFNSAGRGTVRIATSASSVSTANICRTLAVSPNGGITTGTSSTWLAGAGQTIFSSITVLDSAGAWVVCVVPAGGQVLSVNY
jgi:hypothetical protein